MSMDDAKDDEFGKYLFRETTGKEFISLFVLGQPWKKEKLPCVIAAFTLFSNYKKICAKYMSKNSKKKTGIKQVS